MVYKKFVKVLFQTWLETKNLYMVRIKWLLKQFIKNSFKKQVWNIRITNKKKLFLIIECYKYKDNY